MIASVLVTNEGALVEVEGGNLDTTACARAHLETKKLEAAMRDELKAEGRYDGICQRKAKETSFKFFRRQEYKGSIVAVFIEED